MRASSSVRGSVIPMLMYATLCGCILQSQEVLGSNEQQHLGHDNVYVETTLGSVKGYVDNGVNVFNSIPFAQPPTGNLRFRAPQPAKPWKGVKDASKLSWVCPQLKLDGDLLLVRKNTE